MARTKVSKPDGSFFYTGKVEACAMVARGLALRLTKRAIQIIQQPNPPPKGELKCGQESVYESIGIEKFPVTFNGGLTRTEHKPKAKIPRFQAARVPH